MGRIKDLMPKASVHERKLEFRTYPLEDDRLIVEGILKDERFVDRYHLDGSYSPPGVVHLMIVRLLFSGWPLSIQDAEAEMPGVPYDQCPSTLESVKNVIGLTVVHGFSDQVLRRLGGIKGCTHMMHLVTAMGTAVLHGHWSQKLSIRHPIPDSLEELPELSYVVNSCQPWKEDGPLLANLRTAIENRKRPKTKEL